MQNTTANFYTNEVFLFFLVVVSLFWLHWRILKTWSTKLAKSNAYRYIYIYNFFFFDVWGPQAPPPFNH